MTNLHSYVEEVYGFAEVHLRPAPRGFYGETYLVDVGDTTYFLKVLNKVKFDRLADGFKQALPVVDMLYSKYGIKNIARPIPTTDDSYSFDYQQYVGAIYEYIKGQQTYDYDIRKYADLLAEIHSVDVEGISLAQETTDIPYADQFIASTRMLFAEPPDDEVIREIREILEPKRDELKEDWQELLRVQKLAQAQLNPSQFRLTHNDGPGNVILKDDEIFLIDWDELKLAPVERDIWIHVGNPDNVKVNKRFMDRYKFHFPDYEVDETWFRFYLYWKHFEYITVGLQVVLDPSFGERRRKAVENVREGYQWTGTVIRNLERCFNR